MKTSFIPLFAFVAISLSSCVVDPMYDGSGYAGNYSSGYNTYNTLPGNYVGGAYFPPGRYTDGRYQTGSYAYQGRPYSNRYFYNGQYLYGGSHQHHGSDRPSIRPISRNDDRGGICDGAQAPGSLRSPGSTSWPGRSFGGSERGEDHPAKIPRSRRRAGDFDEHILSVLLLERATMSAGVPSQAILPLCGKMTRSQTSSMSRMLWEVLRNADVALFHPLDHFAHLVGDVGIERCCGLVEHEQLGVVEECLHQIHACRFTRRELAGDAFSRGGRFPASP